MEEMNEMYDLVIIGSGAAGITAAIYASRAKLKAVWIDSSYLAGGQILNTYEVDNYPGFPLVSGFDLGEAMEKHAAALDMKPVASEVREIEKVNGIWMVKTKKETYATKSIIIGTGADHRHLNIPGEGELAGKGVSYCATCDGGFFNGKTVAVVGGGNVALEDALYLSRFCKKVYLIHRRNEFRGDKVLQDKVFAEPTIELVLDSVPTKINGDESVNSIDIDNVKNNSSSTIEVDGVFIAVGIVPNNSLVKDLVELDKGGYVKAGEDCITSAPGIFAAGDLRSKPLRQIVTATSDGANAVYSVIDYLLHL